MSYRGINSVHMIGRLAKDADLTKTTTGKTYTRFSLAVANGNEDAADFFNWEAWGSTAEFIAQYAHKGDTLYASGYCRMITYDAEGETKRFETKVVDRVEIIKRKANSAETGGNVANTAEFNAVVNESEELPF